MERRKFTREFKLEAVNLVRERGVTVAQAARDLGVHGNVLRRWVRECAERWHNPRQRRRLAFQQQGKQLLTHRSVETG